MFDIAHEVGHVEAACGEVAESATVVAASGGDEAGGGEETFAREEIAARRGIVSIGASEAGAIDWAKFSRVEIAEDFSPHLNAIADCEGVGVWGAFVRAGDDVEAAEDDFGTSFAGTSGRVQRRGRRR